jgi:hypothetical protein
MMFLMKIDIQPLEDERGEYTPSSISQKSGIEELCGTGHDLVWYEAGQDTISCGTRWDVTGPAELYDTRFFRFIRSGIYHARSRRVNQFI